MGICRVALLLAFVGMVAVPLGAAEEGKENKPVEDPVHNELRALRKGLTDAVVKWDIDRQMSYVHKDVVVTWQNGEVVRGHDGLKEFLQRNAAGRVFQGYVQPPEPAELTIMHGPNTGINYGTSVARYNVLGKEFDLTNHWTVTLVKEDGKWLIANYHVSANVLDNPLLNLAKQSLYWSDGVAVVVGLLVGLVVGWMVRRSRPVT
jgi:ketosteroid isomerase-like protein